ncbi:hypothetical protein RNF90_000155 [Shigella flexneri]|nr:hypothetical protein [Shigella flexneri]
MFLAAFFITASAHAWEYSELETGHTKLGTMYTWSSSEVSAPTALEVNCLSTGGAWVKLDTEDEGYQAPLLRDYPGIVKITVGTAEGISYFNGETDLNFWSKGGQQRLVNFVNELNQALTISVLTDDGKTYRIRPIEPEMRIDVRKCPAGVPAMVDPNTRTVRTPEEMNTL